MRCSGVKTISLSASALIVGIISTLTVTLATIPTAFGIERNLTEVAKKLKNWGLVNSKSQSHIHAVEAWKIEEGSRQVVVAVIDTGIDPKHQALAGNIWRDSDQKKLEVFGWNFVGNQPNPTDDHGHGTHVAGIIGAIADPASGVSGVAHRVSIMPVKYYSDSNPGSVNLKNTVKAINYAVAHGARVINYSGGGPEFSEDEYLAIKRAESHGILFVAAAGNEHQDTDRVENYYYPSAYHLSNIVSVAATDMNNNLLKSSNWGKKTVDVTAPGENIFSTLPGGRYGYMTGTSQATAFVSGLAALLLSQNPNLSPQKLKQIIVSSVDQIPQLKNKILSGGRVNAYSALLALNQKKFVPNEPKILAKQPGTRSFKADSTQNASARHARVQASKAQQDRIRSFTSTNSLKNSSTDASKEPTSSEISWPSSK